MVQNEKTFWTQTYGNSVPYYNGIQSARFNITRTEATYMTPDTFNLWATPFTNRSIMSQGLVAPQAFAIDVDGLEQELIQTSRMQDVELVRQEFIRNGIESAISNKISETVRPPPGFGINNSFWAKTPLSKLENQAIPVCSTPINSFETREMVDNHKRSNRNKRNQKENEDYCVFCFNNGEDLKTYMSHSCRDGNGHVMCPRLQRYVCPYCQATGVYAHTKKYCPQKPIITPADLEKMVLQKSTDQQGGQAKGSTNVSRGKRALRF